MGVLKLKPVCKYYLWGGQRLKHEYGFSGDDDDIVAEAWVLSCHPDGSSIIAGGKYDGKTLAEYIKEKGRACLGTNCSRFEEFPILAKFIDARDHLSIQVHPGNEYALKNEGQYGKTEMWYILDAEPDAFLYYGFKEEISEEEFAARIKNNTLLEVLNAAPVKKGDVFFIESGTLHAVGKGILLAEIQQNSNVTYRIYDYGRVGKDGKTRELHIDKALAVTRRAPAKPHIHDYPHLADCEYFTVDKFDLDGKITRRVEGDIDEKSFLSIMVLDGAGTITAGGDTVSFKKGDSLFLPAATGTWQAEGVCDALLTWVREQ